MGIRDDGIPLSFIRLLQKLRPELKLEPVQTQQAFAYLVWVSAAKSRQHKERKGYMSIAYQELEKHFGRGKFNVLNERLRFFSTTNWSHVGSLTRGYKLIPDLETAVSKWLAGWRRRMQKVDRVLVGLDGKKLHQIPRAVASKVNRPRSTRHSRVLN